MKNSFRHGWLLAISCGVLAVTLAGCANTRSISNSGYAEPGARRARVQSAELSEFDVLGLQRGAAVTEQEIQQALDVASRVRVRKGSSMLVIQSGAYQPDSPMTQALARHVNVVPFNGQSDSVARDAGSSYAKALRLAAARAGCETVLCYWGTLESARRNLETKSVSWVPVVGWMLPDEKQYMRIRLKLALVEVRSGNWTMFAPEAFDSKSLSSMFTKEAADQGQVEKLKRLAYETAAADVIKIYSN